MATKRRPMHSNSSSKLNFRPASPPDSSSDLKGKKPLPEPTTVRRVLLMMVLHMCRKTLFFDTNLKVGIYGGSIFLVSLVTDVFPFPRTYFARSDNIFNQYFVKLGWGWTLLMTFPFVVLTSYTYCCGKRDKVFVHLSRLGIATFMWFFWTSVFQFVEANYGRCLAKSSLSKAACIAKGHMWSGFDISGHAFILIYSSLVLIEEARAINGWEKMSDLIRTEGYTRETADSSSNVNPLKVLSLEEFTNLKEFYEKFTPYIHVLFIAMTGLCILWDVMLVSTMLYYHIMIEKFISSAIAILTWFFTYRFWYRLPRAVPNSPGDGLFKYSTSSKQPKDVPLKKRTSNPSTPKGQLPKFMGMPLYGLRNQEQKEEKDDNLSADDIQSSSRISLT